MHSYNVRQLLLLPIALQVGEAKARLGYLGERRRRAREFRLLALNQSFVAFDTMQGGIAASLASLPTTAGTLELSSELWELLLAQLESTTARAEPEQLTVAVSASFPVGSTTSSPASQGRPLQTLVVHARKATEVRSSAAGSSRPLLADRSPRAHQTTATGSTVYAPRSLIAAHAGIFGRPRPAAEAPFPTLLISLTRPVPLSSVILVALDTESYATATADAAAFERRMEEQGDVVREGEVIAGQARELGNWKVAMAEPVLQGIVKRGFTSFLVLPSPSNGVQELENGEEHAEVEQGDTQDDEETVRGAEDSEEDDVDAYEIDEAFLAASVLSPPRRSLPPTPISPPRLSPNNGLALTNGHASFPLSPTASIPAPKRPTSSLSVTARPLQHSVHSALLVPRPRDDEDDTPRVYLRTQDLGRLGLFSGDWVVVGTGDEGHGRLARAFAGEGLRAETATADG